jgi:threonine/homoserine/homoserine lactone efflux protein
VGRGAAAADAVYGAIAGFGLTAVSALLVRQQGVLRMVGGLFLGYLGIRAFVSRPAEEAAPVRGAGLLGAFAATFALTLANPATILSFIAVFAGLGIAGAGSWRDATVLVAGVFLGSAAWWLILSGVVGALRSRVQPEALRWVNRLSGVVLLAFSGAALFWR